MSTMVWDEAGARYYETGVSKGILWTPEALAAGGVGVPWNGLVAVNLDPQGGEPESYWFDGVKYMNRILAEDFQATIQAISTPKEFRACEGDREFAPGVMTSFNKRDKFHMAWRTEIGSDAGVAVGHKWHIAYNNLVQPSGRNYQTIADTTAMDTRSFIITATPACARQSYFWFDSRDYDLSDLEALLLTGVMPKCYELKDLVTPLEGTPVTDDDCLSTLETLESYIPGQSVDEDPKSSQGGLVDTYIYGRVNNGLDTTNLPAEGAFAANDSAASEVGTGSLTDDDDATYITSADGDLGYTVGLPPLVGYVEGASLELHIRMSISGGVNTNNPDDIDADAQVHISTDADGDDTIGGFSDGTDEGVGFALSSVDGEIVDYVVPLSMDAWVDTTIDDVIAALNAGAFLNVVGVTNNNEDTSATVNVYEMSIVVQDSTDPSKSLRAITPGDYALLEQHIFQPSTTDEVVASCSYEIDFMCSERPGDIAFAGNQQDPITNDNFVLLGTFDDNGDGNTPIFQWFDGDVSHSVSVADFTPKFNTWYHAVFDKDWDTAHLKIVERISGLVVLEDSHSSSAIPNAFMQFYGGYIGNTDASKGYEISIDNAKIQIHCHDDPPPPPPGDYELIVYPTSMTSEGSTDTSHSPFIVGTTGTALIDGDDASYGWATWLRTVKGVYPLWTAVEPQEPTGLGAGDIDPTWVTSISTRFRAKAVEADAVFYPWLMANSSKALTKLPPAGVLPLSFAAADTWEDFDFTFSDWDTTGWAPSGMASALSIGSYLYTRTVPVNATDNTLLGDYNIQVSEQCLVIKFTIP